jgi:hypothetical protein
MFSMVQGKGARARISSTDQSISAVHPRRRLLRHRWFHLETRQAPRERLVKQIFAEPPTRVALLSGRAAVGGEI